MTIDIAIVFIILIGAVILFANEKVPVDLTALIIMAVLLITGIINPEESIAGFSNTATVTVASMFIIAAAVFKTGALNSIGKFLARLFELNFSVALAVFMLIIGTISAFINVTAVVAVFLPVVLAVGRKTKISPSRILMPLSFGALMGGVTTLIGTSTNILVSSIAEQHGQMPFHMFEMTPLGLVVMATGILYMIIIGRKTLPDRKRPDELIENYNLGDYITEIILLPEARSVDHKIKDSPLVKELDIDIIEIQREGEYRFYPSYETVLRANDFLRVRCNINDLKALKARQGIELKSSTKFTGKEETTSGTKLVEAVITPNSRLRGRTIKEINFRNTFGGTVLAIRHRGKLMREKLAHTPLVPGDVLLIEVKKDWLPQLRKYKAFVILSELDHDELKTVKLIPALLIVAGVILTAALGIMPIVATAVIGAVLMVITGIISLEEAYKSIEWKVIFLLAGVLTLGIALEKTGGASLISQFLINVVGGLGNQALISAFFLLTLLFTNFMSNTATAAIIAPIAILTAETLGVSARPFIMAVTFAASLSFITPVGYQTNVMIMGPGNYKFMDYVKVGGPLDLILWIIASLLIPVLYPL